jgi:hypothetical protein
VNFFGGEIMVNKFALRNISFFFTFVMIATLILAGIPTTSATAAPVGKVVASNSSGKQIAFVLNDTTLKLTSVIIQGYNQNNEWSKWSQEDNNGFSLAFTKDWWWTESFVQIDFVIQDNQGNPPYTETCLIDALDQSGDSSIVVISYNKTDGCVGGEAGSAQEVLPVRDAFNTVSFYLSDFQMDVFMDILYKELNVVQCVGGTALAFQTGGASYALAAATITGACEKTGKLILETFFTKP